MDLGLSRIIRYAKDPGDRNRTSPFTFSENRFEFRAVGSQQSVSGPLIAMLAVVARLDEAAKKDEFATTDEHMQYCATVIRTLMDEVRLHADALEAEIADEQWPLPKYREMLFIK